MGVLFLAAIFSAGLDRLGPRVRFLREMLVAPVSRASIVIGKCLGGATIATMQGLIMLALPGWPGCPTTRS